MCSEAVYKKKYYTLKDIEDMGLMSHTVAWRQVKSGALRAVQIGSAIRVPIEALDEFVQTHMVTPEKN